MESAKLRKWYKNMKKEEGKINLKHQAEINGEKIVIRGARTHNLKNISLEIPRNKITIRFLKKILNFYNEKGNILINSNYFILL
jgi:hypothetical protein